MQAFKTSLGAELGKEVVVPDQTFGQSIDIASYFMRRALRDLPSSKQLLFKTDCLAKNKVAFSFAIMPASAITS